MFYTGASSLYVMNRHKDPLPRLATIEAESKILPKKRLFTENNLFHKYKNVDKCICEKMEQAKWFRFLITLKIITQ